jgi:hypothetical protein
MTSTAASRLPGKFWPLSPDVTPVEKVAQLRALCALTAVFAGSGHPLIDMLRRAETDRDAAAEALAMFDQLPSLPRRHVISTFAAIMRPGRGRSP